MKAHGLLLLIVAPLSDALRLPAVRLATPTIGLVPGRENYRCVAPRLTTTASAIDVGEQIQVELEDDDGALVWAAARVQRLEEDGFMVLVTEWDSLPTNDPRREEAYEEGPYRMDEEGEEWRRVAPTAMPAGEVMFDRARHETYDYEAEAALTAKLVAEIALLKRFGIDKSERGTWPALSAACDALGRALIESPAPQVREDPRLVGDWELVATTSTDIADRGGVTPVRLRPYLTA